jgi:hypothetical protein
MATPVRGPSSRRNDPLVALALIQKTERGKGNVRDFNTIRILPSLERAGWIVVILSVVTVFLVPSGFGPYSAVNGPTTVFKSIQHADAVRAAVSHAVLLGIRPLVSMIYGRGSPHRCFYFRVDWRPRKVLRTPLLRPSSSFCLSTAFVTTLARGGI